MKKNIGYYDLSPKLMEWIKEKFCERDKAEEKTEKEKSAEEKALQEKALQEKTALMREKKELCRGIEALMEGDYDVLSLARAGNIRAESAYLLEREGEQRIDCGRLLIDARARTVLRDGKEIYLTPKEFDILYFLVQNRGQVFTKEQIYEAVWRGDYLMDDSNIMAFIRKLRKKIEPYPDAPEYILTIWGVGYKFNDRLQ